MSQDIFDVTQAGVYLGHYLGIVTSVQDPDSLGRVQIRLINFPGESQSDGEIWARVAVPFAGDDRGMYMLPDIDDEVLISFVNGDPRAPIIVGGLWSGSASPPDQYAGDGVDRYVIKSKQGTTIGIYEESSPNVVIETPGGVKVTITDEGSKVELTNGTSTATLEPAGLTLTTPGTIKFEAATIKMTAGLVDVETALAKFSAVVKCEVIQATTVLGTTYLPGAGNIW